MIYIGVMTYGAYDDRDFKICGVSTNRSEVITSILIFDFPDEDNNYGYLETWENNVKIKEELIRE